MTSLTDLVDAADRRHSVFADRLQDPLAFEQGHKFHFSAKDNLCSREFQARAGSKILEGYRPPFDATPIRKLREAGGLLIGKTNMDEFGFGTFSTNSGYGVPKNPFDVDRSCGGSSGGAAAAACLIPGHVALGVSTGGSISCPASFCGVVGLTPTYGRVSRYGLIDYGNSLDKVGILSRTAKDLGRYFPAIAGPDAKDPTSQAQPALDMSGKVSSVAVPEEALNGLSPEVRKAFDAALGKLKEMGVETHEVNMPSLKYAISSYYILATSEASTNLARYCGMRFGVMNDKFDQGFNEFFSETRSEDFGAEAKRRILLGTFSRMVGFRNRYYMKALQVRQLIIREYQKVFGDHDVVLTPTMPFTPPRFDEIARMKPLEMYQADFLTVPPNLAGMPHLSIPCGYHEGLPVGMQAVAPHWQEGRLICLAKMWEDEFTYIFPEVSE
ncbi:amidase family protein [Methanomassiliicoccus luminyensis]|uniref:amidase family protein n=1 Tax=Methanomassiliicoccus luminyensis TaxID=1080712 RepID=UPI00037E05CB|nr:amidase family protein [Methanomassiliicoccus luminyensis]